jgi:hypothetical protein
LQDRRILPVFRGYLQWGSGVRVALVRIQSFKPQFISEKVIDFRASNVPSIYSVVIIGFGFNKAIKLSP